MAALGCRIRLRHARKRLDWGEGPHRILYLRHDKIGDMVLATGIIKAIAVARPAVTIDVLASTLNSAVLAGNPYVGRVVTIDKRRPWTYLAAISRIRRTRYDAVVDPMILSPSLTTTLLACLSGARHRIGVMGRGNDSTLTMPVPAIEEAVHYIDRSAALLEAFGLEPRRQMAAAAGLGVGSTGCGLWKPELFLNAAELREGEAHWRAADVLMRGQSKHAGPRRLVVNVSASETAKYWPPGHFIATITQIRKTFPELSTLIVGTPQDFSCVAAIGREANVRAVFTPHYRQMMAIIAASDVVLTPDTSVTHVASAFRKPAVVLFVGGGAACYGTYGVPGRVISSGGASLEVIGVEPVVRALQALLTLQRERRESLLPREGSIGILQNDRYRHSPAKSRLRQSSTRSNP